MENIFGGFPRLERRIYTCLFCFRQRIRTVRALLKAFLVLSTFRTKNIHISCLFLLMHSSYDRYSLTSKNYEPHMFYRKHFWWFFTFRTKLIHMSFLFLPAPSHLFSVSASALAPLALYRKHFWCFPHLERRISTYLVCFC